MAEPTDIAVLTEIVDDDVGVVYVDNFKDAITRMLAGPKGILMVPDGTKVFDMLLAEDKAKTIDKLPAESAFSFKFGDLGHVIVGKSGILLVPKSMKSEYPLPYPLPKDTAEDEIPEEVIEAEDQMGRPWNQLSHVVVNKAGSTLVPASEPKIELKNVMDFNFKEATLVPWSMLSHAVISDAGVGFVPAGGEKKYPYPAAPSKDHSYPYPHSDNGETTSDSAYPYPFPYPEADEDGSRAGYPYTDGETTNDELTFESVSADTHNIYVTRHGVAISKDALPLGDIEATDYKFGDKNPRLVNLDNVEYFISTKDGITIIPAKRAPEDFGDAFKDFNDWPDLPMHLKIAQRVAGVKPSQVSSFFKVTKTLLARAVDMKPSEEIIKIDWADLTSIDLNITKEEKTALLFPDGFELTEADLKEENAGPRSEEERAMAHFKISKEDWDKLSEEEKQDYIAKLPARGTAATNQEVDQKSLHEQLMNEKMDALKKQTDKAVKMAETKETANLQASLEQLSSITWKIREDIETVNALMSDDDTQKINFVLKAADDVLLKHNYQGLADNPCGKVVIADDAERVIASFVDAIPSSEVETVTVDGETKQFANAMKAIVLAYQDGDGNKLNILKCPDAVKDSVPYWDHAFLTDGHPQEKTVTSIDQVKGFTKNPTWNEEEQCVRVELAPEDGLAFDEKSNISPGFFAELVMQAGDFAGQTYDAIQTKILPNHLAKVDRGRCTPEQGCRVYKMADSTMSTDEAKKIQDQVKKLTDEVTALKQAAKKPIVDDILSMTDKYTEDELLAKNEEELIKLQKTCEDLAGSGLSRSKGSKKTVTDRVDDAYSKVGPLANKKKD